MVTSLFTLNLFQGFLFLLTTFLITPPPVKATASVKQDELAVIDDDVARFLQRWQIPGATVALAKDDKLVYTNSFGVAEEDVPMQTDHLFRIASLSKPITALAIMKLAQDSSLHLEHKVFGPEGILKSELYADFKDPRMQEITVQHLLEHTAGWNRDTSPEGDPMFSAVKIAAALNVPAPADAISVIRYMLQQPLDFTPGTAFAYSNLGYNILGRVIEEISQLPYEDYVQQEILQPLGITDMVLGRNLYENKNRREVKYFDLHERMVKTVSGNDKKVPYPYGGFNLEAMDSHGGWIASAPDLIKLLMALDDVSEQALLKPATVAQMIAPSNPENNYAKGWFVNERGNFWHTGALIGTASLMAHLENGMKWVLLLNARPEHPEFYPELDRLMWKATAKVQNWPQTDLLKPATELVALPVKDPEVLQ